jgi:cytochrome c oxidase assembly protein subunit 11
MEKNAPLARMAARRTAWYVVLSVVVMAGLAYASVPLYRLFCQTTGFAGTPVQTKRMPQAVKGEASKVIMVRFNSDVAPDLPWAFKPVNTSMRTKTGEPFLTFFEARNESNEPIVGTATFNVTPLKAGKYFHKIECFCFQEQRIAPGERVLFPVSFWIDPTVQTDKNASDIETITLSYTFFRKVLHRANDNERGRVAAP